MKYLKAIVALAMAVFIGLPTRALIAVCQLGADLVPILEKFKDRMWRIAMGLVE